MEIDEFDLYTAGAEGQDPRATLEDLKCLNISIDWPEEDIYTACDAGPRPSAPLDVTKVRIKVDWTGAFPERWGAKLEMAVQSWLSKLEGKPSVLSLKLMEDDPSCAEVQITPSSEDLESCKTTQLKFKDGTVVTAQIILDEAQSATEAKLMLEENRAPSPKQDIYTASYEKLLDIVKCKLKVDWTGAFPEKWRFKLEKALQTCLSRLEGSAFVLSLKLVEDDPSCAEVEITPSSAFKKPTTISLKFKDINKDKDGDKKKEKEVTAWIVLDEADPVTVPPKNTLDENRGTPETKVNDSLTSAEESYKKDFAASIFPQNETPETAEVTPGPSAPILLPLHLSWYLYNACSKEMEGIGGKYGVNISAKVSVTIKPKENSSSDSVSKATEDFEKLVQGCQNSFSHATIDHNDMDSDTVKEAIHSIQSGDTKMMFTLTNSNGMFSGPKRFTDLIEDTTRATKQFKDKPSPMNVEKNLYPQHRPSLSFDTNDLLNELEMDEVYWDLMKLSHEEQLSQLEAKYRVKFKGEKTQKSSTIKIEARSTAGQHNNLERHAIRALTRLYQKLASATVTCDLTKASDQDHVTSEVNKLRQEQHWVIEAGVQRSWRLVGLPEYLGPAIDQIEKRLQRKVFNPDMKKLIGYSEDIPHARGIKRNQMSPDG